jgi:hypothetical protein
MIAPTSTFPAHIKKLRIDFRRAWIKGGDAFIIGNEVNDERYSPARFLVENLPRRFKALP